MFLVPGTHMILGRTLLCMITVCILKMDINMGGICTVHV